MKEIVFEILKYVNIFFLIYLLIYATYLFASVVQGALRLYNTNKLKKVKNVIKHDFYFPVSILVPAYNEEVTIVDSILSLLELDYRLYEIIVVDDGSKDRTSDVLIEKFNLKKVNRPIRKAVKCKDAKEIYESNDYKVKITLVKKYNGGKGDALNMGINASSYPYFICMDADSMLQRDSLEKIVMPLMSDDKTVAVGGLVRVAQCVKMDEGNVVGYHLPVNDPVICMQVMEYDRSFLASRILMDGYNGNMIISGAFGLFKKDIVIACGGYDTATIGEDMELVVRIHEFCCNNKIPYNMHYATDAVCWSQAPTKLGDLKKQRRRWHLGLFQSLMKHSQMFMNPRYGLVGNLSYFYYLFYELLSPFIEVIGWIVMILSIWAGLLNFRFMISLYLLYAIYGAVITITAFFQRIYTQNLRISRSDLMMAIVMCFVENIFFKQVLEFFRITAFIGYGKNKHNWGSITRVKQEFD